MDQNSHLYIGIYMNLGDNSCSSFAHDGSQCDLCTGNNLDLQNPVSRVSKLHASHRSQI